MTCRACGSSNLGEVYDFGLMPLAGDYQHGINAKRYPLQVDHCEACGVLQVRQTVPHEVLFNDQYCYASSTVPALRTHFVLLAELIKSTAWRTDLRVLEIGSNDGVLLTPLRALGIDALGVDASENLVDVCLTAGLSARHFAFNSQTATELMSGGWDRPFDIVTCSNVFAQNDDPNDFLEGVKKVLIPDGKLIIEVHDSYALYSKLQWDCFYHEHVFYWNVPSLRRILERHGFTLFKIERIAMHGGALRIIAHNAQKKSEVVNTLTGDVDWNRFGKDVKRSIDVLSQTLSRLPTTYLYTAPGRSATLLNTVQHKVVSAFDGSPLRAGKLVPGQAIRICPEVDFPGIIELINGYVLLGAWHLQDQLIPKLEPFKHHIKGIITPLPNVMIE